MVCVEAIIQPPKLEGKYTSLGLTGIINNNNNKLHTLAQ